MKSIILSAAALAVMSPLFLFAQGIDVITAGSVERLKAKRNDTATAKVHFQVKPGYHVNSNKPADEYLIPLRLTWTGPLKAESVDYPKPQMEKYSFSEKPLSVYTSDFDVLTKFQVPAATPAGPAIATGKLRYQACNDRMCLPPKTIEVSLSVEVH